jgi:hypothetical protein
MSQYIQEIFIGKYKAKLSEDDIVNAIRMNSSVLVAMANKKLSTHFVPRSVFNDLLSKTKLSKSNHKMVVISHRTKIHIVKTK